MAQFRLYFDKKGRRRKKAKNLKKEKLPTNNAPKAFLAFFRALYFCNLPEILATPAGCQMANKRIYKK